MAYQDQFYTAGTVTVTNGSATVTGAGTGWETALIVGGVFYAGGGAYPIQSVSGETELTLAIPYVGIDATGVGYAIDRQRAAAISNIAMNDRLAQIIREISIGNIEDLNALELIANQIIRTDASGNITQSDITAAALVLLKLAGAVEADKLPFFDSANSAALTDLTPQARTMLASTTPAIASLGYTPVNKSGDSGLKAMSWDEAPNNWQHRFTTTVTLAPAANFVFSPGSGLIIAAENAGGSVAAFLVGGGGYKLLGQSIGAYWADTPSATLFMQYAGGTYYIGNGSGVTKTLFIAALQVRSVS
ncbi:hypothetical protein IB024_00330 [Brucella sp. 6810]|uniref:hypothetical protein n=1 Tax=Brucella sp. 6810 TaxID=2769351 RepID=UPI00165BBC59|nr:hypothetical protein [Brucella sp. 6810]QNQ62247.1 hypothetical protein IB024_00330 [Brucella sp. 6810]